MGQTLSLGLYYVRRRLHAIPRYGRFGVDGLTVECKRCRENSCRRGATLFPSLCRPVFTLVNALALLRLQGLVAPSGHVLSWWRSRKQVHETTEKLARTTWHVAPRWVEAVRREADLTGESYAAVVNRAFATYFR